METEHVEFSFPWDKFTFRGFVISIAVTCLTLFIVAFFNVHFTAPAVDRVIPQTGTLVLLNFGDGDGTGLSKGNLSKEGAANKGADPNSPIQDAMKQGATKPGQVNPLDPTQTSNMTPASQITGDKRSSGNSNDWGSSSIGSRNGSSNGTGLGDKGNGTGKGYGLGDIDWGGGGNRRVENKVEPICPKGSKLGSRVTMEFTVLKDGSVDRAYPVVKGDPALEDAAMRALKKWRFNRIDQDVVMKGKITFVFRLN